jgi:hypothetical protein
VELTDDGIVAGGKRQVVAARSFRVVLEAQMARCHGERCDHEQARETGRPN